MAKFSVTAVQIKHAGSREAMLASLSRALNLYVDVNAGDELIGDNGNGRYYAIELDTVSQANWIKAAQGDELQPFSGTAKRVALD